MAIRRETKTRQASPYRIGPWHEYEVLQPTRFPPTQLNLRRRGAAGPRTAPAQPAGRSNGGRAAGRSARAREGGHRELQDLWPRSARGPGPLFRPTRRTGLAGERQDGGGEVEPHGHGPEALYGQ